VGGWQASHGLHGVVLLVGGLLVWRVRVCGWCGCGRLVWLVAGVAGLVWLVGCGGVAGVWLVWGRGWWLHVAGVAGGWCGWSRAWLVWLVGAAVRIAIRGGLR